MADISAAEREKIPDEDFAGPHRSFPIRNQQDVHDAARLIGKADDPAAVKDRIKAIAKRKGLSLPDAWKDDGDEEGAREATSTSDMPATAGNTQMMSVFSEEHHHGAVHHSHPHYHGGSHEDHDDHTHCPDCGSDARLCGHKAAQAALEKAAGMVNPSQAQRAAREAAAQFEADRAILTRASEQVAATRAAFEADDALVREAQTAPRSNRVRVRFMTAGPGNRKDGHYYTPEAVQALVPLIKGQPKMFLDHSLPSQVRERGHRALAELAGIAVRESVRYDAATQATMGDVVLRPKMAEYIETAREAGDTIGVSIDGVGTFRAGPSGKECTGWAGFHSADFVPAGGAGGFTLDVREADSPALAMQEREFTMSILDDLTPREVRETAYDLYEAIGKEYTAAQGTQPAAGPPPAEVERLVRENAALAARLDALDAERNREQTAGIVRDTITATAQLDKKQVEFVADRFKGAMTGEKHSYKTPDDLKQAVRESTVAYVESIPKERTGYITDLGGAVRGDANVRESGQTVPSADDATFATLDSWVGQAYFNRAPAPAAQG